MTHVLVCGDYADRDRLWLVLDSIRPTAIIHGAARGADTLASQYARENHVPELAFPADWEKYGRAAGPIRNQLMLENAKPSLVVAFPGGAGTADMVQRAKTAGIDVIEVERTMSNQTYRIGGVMFENKGNGPAFTGEIEIEGVKYPITLWRKTSKKGNEFFQISEDRRPGTKQPASQQVPSPYTRQAPVPQSQPQGQHAPVKRTPVGDDMDGDEIPFAPEFR